MTTELRRGGNFTKINIKGYLKDITNNETTTINTTALKNNQKLSYYLDKEKYILKIISPSKLILNRQTNEIDSTLYFELNKVVPAIYIIKENNLSLEINVRTNKFELSESYIKVSYTVIDSDTNYEYYIEMSE